MSDQQNSMAIVGYADKVSVGAGDTIAFKVSCALEGSYHADLVRVICGDRQPGGAGFEEQLIEADFNGYYPAKYQAINQGSYATVELPFAAQQVLQTASGFTMQALIYPTTPLRAQQGLCGTWTRKSDGTVCGASLVIDEGELALLYADSEGKRHIARSGHKVAAFRWQLVAVSYDQTQKMLTFLQWPPLKSPSETSTKSPRTCTTRLEYPIAARSDYFTFAGLIDNAAKVSGFTRNWIIAHYNGKIDSPRWSSAPLSAAEIKALSAHTLPKDMKDILGFWDFSRDIPTEAITDCGPFGLHGKTLNLPAKGVTGANWDGIAQSWVSSPELYGAIHFHDDDVHDCQWETEFSFKVPDVLASGIYAVRLKQEGQEYRIAFFVFPAKNVRKSDIVFVASTATYLAYANSAQAAELIYAATKDERVKDTVYRTLKAHPEYGRSLYDIHSDGTPRRYASRLRPLIDVQPGVRKAWSLQADTLVTAWLERSGYRFDVVTDDDLHENGPDILTGYRLIITGSHPEYMSLATREAFDAHLAQGGRLIYLGGNGFYLRVAFSDKVPGAMEMRRVSQALEGLWNEESGDHYFSFTGELAGLWTNLDYPSHRTVGVGFKNMMIGDSLSFKLTEAAHSPRAQFIFEEIDGPISNPFGELYGNLASDEFDRFDVRSGSPAHALVVATAIRQPAPFTFMESYQADMVFFETPSGGAVFSTGCISWGLGLNANGRDNDISRVTKNVIDRFIDPEHFSVPSESTHCFTNGGPDPMAA